MKLNDIKYLLDTNLDGNVDSKAKERLYYALARYCDDAYDGLHLFGRFACNETDETAFFFENRQLYWLNRFGFFSAYIPKEFDGEEYDAFEGIIEYFKRYINGLDDLRYDTTAFEDYDDTYGDPRLGTVMSSLYYVLKDEGLDGNIPQEEARKCKMFIPWLWIHDNIVPKYFEESYKSCRSSLETIKNMAASKSFVGRIIHRLCEEFFFDGYYSDNWDSLLGDLADEGLFDEDRELDKASFIATLFALSTDTIDFGIELM